MVLELAVTPEILAMLGGSVLNVMTKMLKILMFTCLALVVSCSGQFEERVLSGKFVHHKSGDQIHFKNRAAVVTASSPFTSSEKITRQLNYKLGPGGELHFFPLTSNEALSFTGYRWHGDTIVKDSDKVFEKLDR